MVHLEESNTRDLWIRGIAAAKAKEDAEARFFLELLLQLDPPEDERIDALYWLSEVCHNPIEQRGYIEDILARDPGEPRARRKLAILDGHINPADIINPDQLPQSVTEKTISSGVDRFTCPHCGGRMTYLPDGQSLTCESCDTRQNLRQLQTLSSNIKESDFLVALASKKGHLRPMTQHTYTCQGCGASFILQPDQITLTCPYCRSNYAVNHTEIMELLAPDAVIPFEINEVQVRQSLSSWLKSHRIDLSSDQLAVQGIYLPVWSFYIDGKISWRALKSQHDTWTEIVGEEPILFDNILVLATNRLPVALRTAIFHFDLTKLLPYDERYLVNWIAETYNIPVAEASLDARQMILADEKRFILQQQMTEIRDLVLHSANVRVESYKLILFPAWLVHFTQGNEQIDIFINGQDGEIYSNYPTSSIRKILKRIIG